MESKDKLKQARQQLGLFFKEKREQMGITEDVLATHLGLSTNTIKGIESGRFAWDIDVQHRICEALEIKPYFSTAANPHEEDLIHNRKKAESGDFHGFYISENLLLHPEQLAITKLTYPRLFVRFNYGESLFINYDDWKHNITTQEWIDGEKPSDDDVEYWLTECWNFLALHERKEDELFNDENLDDEEI